MKQIVKYIFLQKRCTFAQSANGILYFIRSLPWIGKRIPEKVYQFPRVKTVLAILSFL